MSASFEAAVVAYALGVAAVCAFAAATGRVRSPAATLAVLVVQVTLVVQAVVDVAQLATGAPSPEPATHIGYLVVSLVALPAAAGSVQLDEGRWGSAALAIGCALVAVVSIRLQQTGGHA